MGGTIYKRCDECKRWVHRDETVLRKPVRRNDVDRIRSTTTSSSISITNSQHHYKPQSQSNHSVIPRRICLFCVDKYDRKQSPEFALLAATGTDTRTSGSGRNR